MFMWVIFYILLRKWGTQLSGGAQSGVFRVGDKNFRYVATAHVLLLAEVANAFSFFLLGRKTGAVGTVFPATEKGTELSQPFFKNRKRNRNRAPLLKLHRSIENTLSWRNDRNRKPEPLEPPLARTVTEPNRGHLVYWAPPDPCLPRCVFRDCPCIWHCPIRKNYRPEIFYFGPIFGN